MCFWIFMICSSPPVEFKLDFWQKVFRKKKKSCTNSCREKSIHRLFSITFFFRPDSTCFYTLFLIYFYFNHGNLWFKLISLPLKHTDMLHKIKNSGFPHGSVVRNLPANASITGLGRSHMPWKNSPVCHNHWACALEPRSHDWSPHTLEPHVLLQKKPLNSLKWIQKYTEACVLQLESSRPLTTNREKPWQQQILSTAKINK